MLHQIILGSAVMLGTMLIAGLSFPLMEAAFERFRPWLTQKPYHAKRMAVMMVAVLWVLEIMTAGVWLWALTFRGLGLFEDLEHAVYFSLVCFTTLGFGDVLLPEEWRLMGGLAAANGLLNIGVMTALLVEALRDVRLMQRDS